MLKYRVERLREILDPNYKLELPEQLAEGAGEPKTIIRSNDFIINPARGFCEIVTEPDEDGTGTKISFKNPTYNKDLPGYGTFGRTKDGKEVLKHNKKAFTNPTKWGIDDANKLQEIGCDFTRWAFTTHPTAGYVTTATIHLLNTHKNHQMILRTAVRIGGVFTEYQPTSMGHTFTIQYPDHPNKLIITSRERSTGVFLQWDIKQVHPNTTNEDNSHMPPLLDGNNAAWTIETINEDLPPREYWDETKFTHETSTDYTWIPPYPF